MQDQISFTLSWRSFLEGGSDIVTIMFTLLGSQYIDHGLLLLHSSLNIEYGSPTMVEPPFTLICRI